MKITRKAATAAVASLSLLALAACSSGSSDDTRDDSGINQETAVNVAWESPLFETNTDSSNGNATQNAVITYLTNETFNFYDPDLKLQKNEGFGTYEKTSDDPLTVKYTLSDDATWSDGTPVTAADLLLELGRHLRCAQHDRGHDGRRGQRHHRLHDRRLLRRRHARRGVRHQDPGDLRRQQVDHLRLRQAVR